MYNSEHKTILPRMLCIAAAFTLVTASAAYAGIEIHQFDKEHPTILTPITNKTILSGPPGTVFVLEILPSKPNSGGGTPTPPTLQVVCEEGGACVIAN